MKNYKKYYTSHQSMVNFRFSSVLIISHYNDIMYLFFIHSFVFTIMMYSIKNASIFKIRVGFPSSSFSSSQSSSFERISLSSMRNIYCGCGGHRRQFVGLIPRLYSAELVRKVAVFNRNFLTGFYSIFATQAGVPSTAVSYEFVCYSCTCKGS